MPAYHSAFNDDPVQQIGNTAVLPINWKHVKGSTLVTADPSRPDIVEEALDLFRANCLFRNFEIKGPADRTLIYLILFISDCIAKLAPSAGRPSPGYQEAGKKLATLAVDNFALPGEPGFPLNSMYHPPGSRGEAEQLRSYLTQARSELAARLVERLYAPEPVIGADGNPTGQMGPRPAQPSKWWMSFQKRRFMGRAL
ncbi:ARP2/3 complex, 21 kDa p21-Arc subunit [Cutaneotrichosporon oleaginosum]|uniref:Actin-related protein 2/3 complex subunit 3 n=1 Tax=Cutaneotrichosporon oleaginosum TaxID=879819 RepID=A0A0J0XL01_9TREE|nr:ARP2/3 complex, 21 kDa p21-Arc subunit [Cutaneotrichosporon oleaginosum]KLT41742.1 ARP2/3 complex, 21 kDa p21-Arc subunit [Cutaneotrichosporon oleaginosum]